jgi:hypothetical protein
MDPPDMPSVKTNVQNFSGLPLIFVTRERSAGCPQTGEAAAFRV